MKSKLIKLRIKTVCYTCIFLDKCPCNHRLHNFLSEIFPSKLDLIVQHALGNLSYVALGVLGLHKILNQFHSESRLFRKNPLKMSAQTKPADSFYLKKEVSLFLQPSSSPEPLASVEN